MERRDFLKLAGTAVFGAGLLSRFGSLGWASELPPRLQPAFGLRGDSAASGSPAGSGPFVPAPTEPASGRLPPCGR